MPAHGSGALTLIAPSLLAAEVASALSKRFRRKELTEIQAREAFRLFQVRLPLLVDAQDYLGAAFDLSLILHLALYDCLYLAVAIAEGCDLVTADARFYRGSGRAYPFVRILVAE